MTDNKSDCTPRAKGGLIRLWVKVCELIQTVSPTQKYFTADIRSVLNTPFKMAFWNPHNKSGSLSQSLSNSALLLPLFHAISLTFACSEHAFNQVQAAAPHFFILYIIIKDFAVRAASPFRIMSSKVLQMGSHVRLILRLAHMTPTCILINQDEHLLCGVLIILFR